jgi:nanoRNase/pAp phosphatase (c-di-AMP/oligoRNAs hydrolase)
MLEIEGISTVLVMAVDPTKIHVYAESRNMELNMKNILKDAFGNWGEIIGGSTHASTSIPLGVFGIASNDVKAKQLLLKSIIDSVSSRFFYSLGTE